MHPRQDLYGGTKFPTVDADAYSPYDVPGVPSVTSKPVSKEALEYQQVCEKPIIRETLAQEYNRRFTKQSTSMTYPTRPIKMEWFEEDELAKSLYEMMMTEQELERFKQQLSLKTDFNVADAYGVFDLNATGFITRFQIEEVCNLFG